VRAELIRVFGPGNWDSTIHDVTLVYENQVTGSDNKERWVVCYRAACTLRVRDYEGNQICEFTEYHAEENAPQPNRGEAHALALTSVESYALRRCAIGIGDAFGLHLYNEGSQSALVKGTLMITDYWGETPQQDLSDEQRAALSKSLGATEVTEGNTDDGVPGSTSGPDGVPAATAG
jgi:hypothetical protein